MTHPLADKLLTWYDLHRRTLPWRALPHEKPDPYHIWLSEIMLQQTTVEAVKPYFTNFLKRWPRVEDLAQEHQDIVLDQWAGLGYYARARNLHACARIVTEHFDGRFPDDYATLKSLPGIGDYTAAAIAAIAYNKPVAAVDGNVERVISRLYRLEDPLPAAKSLIREKTQGLVPSRAGDFAQALMDLGATVCTARRPTCLPCPWREQCLAHAQGDMEAFPKKAPKKEKPVRFATAFCLVHNDHIFLRRRPPAGLLGGMLELPTSPWREGGFGSLEQDLSHAPLDGHWRPHAGEVRHTFTHFHLRLRIVSCVQSVKPGLDGQWQALGDLRGLPTVMRKAARHFSSDYQEASISSAS